MNPLSYPSETFDVIPVYILDNILFGRTLSILSYPVSVGEFFLCFVKLCSFHTKNVYSDRLRTLRRENVGSVTESLSTSK